MIIAIAIAVPLGKNGHQVQALSQVLRPSQVQALLPQVQAL
jgi:hypothetical protein